MVTIQGFMQIKPEFHDKFIEKMEILTTIYIKIGKSQIILLC